MEQCVDWRGIFFMTLCLVLELVSNLQSPANPSSTSLPQMSSTKPMGVSFWSWTAHRELPCPSLTSGSVMNSMLFSCKKKKIIIIFYIFFYGSGAWPVNFLRVYRQKPLEIARFLISQVKQTVAWMMSMQTEFGAERADITACTHQKLSATPRTKL